MLPDLLPHLRPKLFSSLRGYTRHDFTADLTAGVIVGIVALPLAIAFAIASGVSPEKGLVTAVIAGFLISALGGSRVQIGGPTGAFVVILYGVIQQHGVSGLLVATFIAGGLLVAMGLAGLGSAIKFIPHPVIVGFTTGIAVIIFSSQVKDILGLSMGAVPADFVEKWGAYAAHITTINPYSLAVAGGSIAIILLWQRLFAKIPGSLVALVLSTAAVAAFQLPVETIGSRFGAIPSALPAPSLPADISFAMIRQVFPSAVTIALLGGIEALLSAVVADGMIGGRHRSNMELVAQGVANLVVPLFGGIPATGAIARTATNIRNGARTPMAGIIHALVLLLIMYVFGSLARLIPMATLGAILLVVAYNMSEWRSFVGLFRSTRGDTLVLVTTFVLTVVIDLTEAIQVGILLSAFLFVRRMADVTNVGVLKREFTDSDEEEENDPQPIGNRIIPHGVEVYEINGPFFFGAAYKFKEAMNLVEKQPSIRIIRMRNVPTIDATGLHALKEVILQNKKQQVLTMFSAVRAQPLLAMEQAGIIALVGEENFCYDIDAALQRAALLLETKIVPASSA
jgi:SulP family sulfate permease